MIERCNHVSITVKDLEAVVAWFRDTLGCIEIWERYEYQGTFIETLVGIPGAHLRLQKIQVRDFVLEFIQYLGGAGTALGGNTNDSGYPHLGFIVDDLQATYHAMKAKGVEFKSAPLTITDPCNPLVGTQLVYLWGPEGMTLELMQMAKR